MDGDGKSSASSRKIDATRFFLFRVLSPPLYFRLGFIRGGVSRRLNSKRKNKALRKRYHLSKKEAEVERLRVLRRRYYMKNYPELGQPGMYARIALEHFNEENVAQGGVEYELVEKQKQKMNFRLSLQSDRWIHVNFKAKPKNAPDTDAVFFFGEVQEPKGGDIIKCCVLNTGDRPGSCIGCRVIHPPSGFRPFTWCQPGRRIEAVKKKLAVVMLKYIHSEAFENRIASIMRRVLEGHGFRGV